MNEKMTSVIGKIDEARQKIRATETKKLGWNTFSKYEYFTPDQISQIVCEACDKLKLFNKYSLLRTEHGLNAIMDVYDMESGEIETFEMAMDIPTIKATNIAQQLGGAVTYSTRYLLMSIYDITNNNLDFDSKTNPDDKITDSQIKMIDSLIHSSTITEAQKTMIEREMPDYSFERASNCISFLNENQKKSLDEEIGEKTRG